MASIQKKTTRTTKTTSTEATGEVQTKSSSTTSAEMTSQKCITITKKGQFFSDSCFEDTRQDYQDAIKDVLSKWGDKTSTTDDMTSYRQLRTRDMRDENMAVKSSDDELYHKIVVDVNEFIKDGDVSVKTVGDRELVVQGRMEKQEGNRKSSKSFKRSFILPEDVEIETLTSVVSSDGVMIIKARRKQTTEQVTGVSKSINVQKTETKKQLQTSSTTTAGQDVKTMVVQTQEVPEETVTQKKVTTVTREVKTMEDDTGSRPLPITKKGSFFDDSFFEDSRQDFQTAIKQVLQKSNVKSQADDITTYRNLRQQNLKEENQAVTVSDDQQTHKIIVDVQDFVNGGVINVKTVDDREVVIEGHIEKQEGNTKSSKRFCKRFTLPEDILVESVSCVVSADGVLTIKAPRKPSTEQVTGVSKTIDVQKTETKKQVQTSTTTTTEGQDVKAVVVKPQEVPEETVTQKKVTTVTREVKTMEDDTGSRPLPITKKGSFFDDSFFEDSRQDFQTAIKQVLQKSNVTSQTDDITTYRNLRQQNLKEENQAVTVSDDQQTHKIIVDVQDFVNGGVINVKTVDDREVVIEGHIEKQEGNTKSSKRFCKRFTLPEDILVESLSCVVSADGVLTIKAPRKPSTEQVTGVSKTIDVQKTETKKQVQTSTTTTSEGQDVKAVVVKPQEVPEETVTQKKVTTVTREVKTMEDDTGSRPLPITKKGSFFDDSFFEDSRQDFQTAIKQVLQKSNVTSQTDDITTYRNLRQQNLKEENQAVTVSDDQQTHKIIVDVQDFVNGGVINVKTVDDREVVIEGHIEKQEGNTKSSKRFCKRFTLPEDILVESLSCVVSADGVLTIKAPRKPSTEQVTGVSKTIDVQKTETKKQVQTSTTTTTEGQDVKAVVVKPQEVPEETQETVTQKKVTTVTREVTTMEDDTGSRPLPITKKGSFFDDSFFEDSRQVFQTAVKQVLEKSNVKSSETDDITTYRNLRQQNLKDDNQAVTVSDDQKTHKIIVDVKDFVDGGEVTVKIVKEREIVIEGHIEKQEGNTKSSKRFCKRFTLSDDILVESVSCVVSDDGVLTIIAPRKPSTEQVAEVSKTIDVQKTETKKQVQTSTTTTTEGQDVKAVVVKPQEVPEETQETVTQKKVTTVTREVTTMEDDTGSRPLPITKKGSFFDDSFFEDSRQVFQTAVKQVLEKSNVKSSETDDITTYRNLRQQNLKEDNQAVTVSDDQKTHKIIVDVKDFADGGEVTVKIVKEREIVIEGHIEKQEGNTKSSKRFCKRFTLSDDILVESVSCVVSDDGVLTIIAPRKPSTEQVTELSKTIDVQKTETKKQVQTSTTTTTEGQDVKAVVVKPQEVPEETQETVTQKKVTTVTREVTTMEDDTGSRPLPITKKGSFFDDSFFEDSRQVFQSAVKQVLEKSNVKSSETDDITTYRNLRQQNLKEDNQAVTVSDDQKTHKIIVDVKDFADGGEVTVKIVKEREIVIEGHIEKQEGNTKSSKRFCKRFTLSDDILVESVSCVVSDDGVLTIIAPRKPSTEQVTELSKTIDVQKTETKKQVQTSTTTTTEGQDVKAVVVKPQEVPEEAQETVTQKKVTTVTREVTTMEDDIGSRPLPITKKGSFFDDSFFEDSRQVFQTAVKQVLEKSNVKSSETDDITTYRNLRQQNLKEDNQAVTVSDDQKTHKIIVDVKDFVDGGEVTVKIVKEREIVIEGHIEKQEGNKKSSKRFCKRFTLSEDILVESVSCVVSDDGVLTIIAPRKPSTEQVTEISKTIDVQKTETKKQVQTSTTTTTEGQDVKAVVVKPQEVPEETQETVTQKKVTTVTREVTTMEDDTGSRPLPITKKGSFFDDSFFEDSRQVFQTAVKQVLEKSNVKSSETDDITTYRNLRQQNLKEDNQAVTVSDDQKTHKIIVDVKDFVDGGEVTVKIVKEREIVIEGHIEKQEGNTKSSKRFCKRFTLSEDILVESVSCVVSDDGVLTIIAPRKPSTEQVTTDIQKTETKKQVQTSTTTTTEGQDVKAVVVKPQEVPEETQETVTQKKVTTVTREVTTMGDDTGSRPLPITKKGSFFDDSFFEDSRQVFQTAVKQVLEKSNVKSSETDVITNYRKLRQQNLKEDNQAVTVSDDQKTHKIIVDVKDFVDGGEVTVKIVKEREIVIEGHIEKQEGNKKSSKRFCKRFTLSEDILVESVSCVVSDDGVLTILAPRKPSTEQVTGVSKTIDVQKTETKKQVQTSTKTTTEGQDVRAVVVKPKEVPEETQETVTQKKVTTVTREVTTMEDDTGSRPLPITKKGSFFDDSFFEDTRLVFQTAIKKVLQKFNVKSKTDDITTYRKLRQQNLKEENQAVTVSDDQKTHKIIVDVKDFVEGGEVTVKIVKEREIVVEGRVEKQEGNTKSTKRFCKRFILSEDIVVESVTCVLSSDGVLTVIAPRKPSAKQVTEEAKTIKTDTKKQDVKETVVKTQKVAKDTQEAVSQKDVDQEKKVTSVTQKVKTVKDESSKETISRVLVIIKKGLFSEDSFFVEVRHVYQKAVKQVLEKMKVTFSQTDYITTYRNMRRRNLTEETQAVTTHDDQQSHKIILDVKEFASDGVITAKVVNEREVVIEGHIEKKQVITKRFCKRFVLSQEVHVESVSCVMSADGVLVITAPRKSAALEKKETTTKTEKSVEKSTAATVDRSTITKPLPITQKGDFFSDATFEGARQDYQSAVKSVLEKLKVKSSKGEEHKTYRNLRKSKPKNENQAVSVKDEKEFTQIVLDVCDFIGGVKVKIVEGSEIVVEGKGNRQEGMSVVSFSFLRRFLVPDDAVYDAITTFMSSEGILTITIPKKQ